MNFQRRLLALAAQGQLPSGVSIDGLGNRLNVRRQERKRMRLSGRQWTKLRKLLSQRERAQPTEQLTPAFSTASNKVAW